LNIVCDAESQFEEIIKHNYTTPIIKEALTIFDPIVSCKMFKLFAYSCYMRFLGLGNPPNDILIWHGLADKSPIMDPATPPPQITS
jgi:hypothetical protein